MSISMRRFGCEGELLRFDPFANVRSERTAKLQIQCRVCNFEPDLEQPLMKVCPKCFSSAWEWFVQRENVQPSERAGHRFKFRRRQVARRRM